MRRSLVLPFLTAFAAMTAAAAEVRRKTAFWLGQSREPRAFDFIEKILK